MTTPAAPATATPPPGASGWVTVDLDAISDNVRELARRAPNADVMAVVKADAYGHGLVPSARAAVAGGATWLAVAQLNEALQLRAAGVTTPLLTWLYAPDVDFGAAIDADIDISVAAPWALDAVVAGGRGGGPPPPRPGVGGPRPGPPPAPGPPPGARGPRRRGRRAPGPPPHASM